MAVLKIVIGPDAPILRKKTVRVKKVTKDIEKLVKDMVETTKNAEGAGIAAPQVNRTERVCIALIGKKLVPMINPDITWKSDEQIVAEEGCLSLPTIWMHVSRSAEIMVEYTDLKGKRAERKLKDWDARVVQHEVDHLEGVLIVDYKQKMVM